MDERTVEVYEQRADDWIARRRLRAPERIDSFCASVRPDGLVVDLGCGPGWFAQAFRERGLRAIALDAAAAMLRAAREREPTLAAVRADLARLPFARESLDGAWAVACYPHLPTDQLPAALAQLHAALRSGSPFEVWLRDPSKDLDVPLIEGEGEHRFDDDPFPDRLFGVHTPERARALVEGAGFDVTEIADAHPRGWVPVRAVRARTLPDLVRGDLRLLVCGLNPSPYAADSGIPFGRPGNRFWPAALRVGLCSVDRDPLAALGDGIGFTDWVKRATRRAAELEPSEYAAGRARLESLVRRYRPRAVCFVGLEGWRRAVDARARAGWIPDGFAGAPAYLMPSTSGLNAHARLDDLARHLETAAGGP